MNDSGIFRSSGSWKGRVSTQRAGVFVVDVVGTRSHSSALQTLLEWNAELVW